MDIIEMTRELGKAIQNSESYKNLEAAKQKNDADENLQKDIGEFNMIRVKLSTLMQDENADETEAAKLDGELKDCYTKVMGNENMMVYNIAKQEVDEIMNKISTILVASVNGEDPATCADTASSCSGGCDSCSGCH